MRVMNIPLILPWFLASCVSAFSNCTLRDHPPAGAICGQRGYLQSPQYFPKGHEQPLNATLQDCQISTYVHSSARRKSFSYNTQGLCLLYTATIEEQNYVLDDNSSEYLYDSSCLRCHNACPAPVGTEILLNPGFEYSNLTSFPFQCYGGYPSYSDNCEIVSPGRSSQYALQNHGTTHIGQGNGLGSRTCPGQRQGLSLDFKFDNLTTGQDTGFAADIAGAEFELSGFTSADNGVWKSYVFSGGHAYATIINGLTPGINLNTDLLNASVTFTVDNIRFVTLPQYINTSSTSLLQNGDFETGSLDPWVVRYEHLRHQKTRHPEYTITSPGLNSQYALRAVSSGRATKYGFISQTVQLVPGTLYVLSLDYSGAPYISGIDDPVLLVRSKNLQMAGSGINTTVPASMQIAPGWYHYELLFQAVDPKTKIILYLPVGGRFDIDNIKLAEAERDCCFSSQTLA